ncbi:Caf20 protein [Maudiozyma humilis]|uniref:Cap-associated protein CAF20 n=1 Tax=Maudiozyma humilis TaxID=51915 RepID=A0AAV5S526_MAUHU|nr:Caf20 protein [Kazachstania humilis]
MPSYTIDELIQLKPSVALSVDFDAAEFKAIIEKVKQVQALKEEEYAAHHGHFGRRRSSHLVNGRPKIRMHKPKVTTDEDGWSTFEPKAGEEGEDTSENTSDSGAATISTAAVKVKPNNRHISSSRPADASDIVADKQVHGFNAFAALVSDDEDE